MSVAPLLVPSSHRGEGGVPGTRTSTPADAGDSPAELVAYAVTRSCVALGNIESSQWRAGGTPAAEQVRPTAGELDETGVATTVKAVAAGEPAGSDQLTDAVVPCTTTRSSRGADGAPPVAPTGAARSNDTVTSSAAATGRLARALRVHMR